MMMMMMMIITIKVFFEVIMVEVCCRVAKRDCGPKEMPSGHVTHCQTF